MSHQRDPAIAEVYCRDHGGFAEFRGGAKLTLKAECRDGTQFYMSDGDMVTPASDGEVVFLGCIFLFLASLLLIGLFKE